MAAIGMSEMVQAVLTGIDTQLSRKWREEERGWKDEERRWRKEDLMFRSKEFESIEAERRFMCEQRGWRSLDLEQRALENARVLWQRFVEKNRRSVEEHSEQLKSISNLSALVAGFSVIGFLEFQFEERDQPSLVTEFFGMFTALTVVLMVNSFVSCSLILASILKTGKRYVAEAEEAEFMWQCRRFYLSYMPGSRPPMPHRTFEQHWQNRCESEWRRAFYLFTAGVPCFLAQLTLAAWIKFDDSLPTAIIMTTIIVASIPYWAVVQYRWSEHLFTKDEDYKTASGARPPMGLPFDYHRAPQHAPRDSEGGTSWTANGSEDPGGAPDAGAVSMDLYERDSDLGISGLAAGQGLSPSTSWSRAERALFMDTVFQASVDREEIPLQHERATTLSCNDTPQQSSVKIVRESDTNVNGHPASLAMGDSVHVRQSSSILKEEAC